VSALDELGKKIAAAAAVACIPFQIVHEDGQYLYQLPNRELLTPGEFADMLGVERPLAA
jgi:hypothetical protein